MAHSILEFGENQLIMRDAELLAVLEQMQDSLRDNPDDKLDFLSEFLLSDMVHVTGGLDPDLDRHLNTASSRDAFLNLIDSTCKSLKSQSDRKLQDNLRKLKELVS